MVTNAAKRMHVTLGIIQIIQSRIYNGSCSIEIVGPFAEQVTTHVWFSDVVDIILMRCLEQNETVCLLCAVSNINVSAVLVSKG